MHGLHEELNATGLLRWIFVYYYVESEVVVLILWYQLPSVYLLSVSVLAVDFPGIWNLTYREPYACRRQTCLKADRALSGRIHVLERFLQAP